MSLSTPSWINDPVQVLAHTIWAENRSGGYDGMQSVANAICNRAASPRWWGKDILSVCLKPWQFSCWNPYTVHQPANADYEAMINATAYDTNFGAAVLIARSAVAGTLPDITQGADSYYAPAACATPKWVAGAKFTTEIENQRFYITI